MKKVFRTRDLTKGGQLKFSIEINHHRNSIDTSHQ